MHTAGDKPPQALALRTIIGQRIGPYNSFNPVNSVQIWQWNSAMGDHSPLYLDENYQARTEFAGRGAVAPPAMMQMWTMRDVNNDYASGSTTAHPYQVMEELEALGFPANVAVSYDISFHRYLVAGDRVHHYKSVREISELKVTALGEGHFFTDRMEYLDQNGVLFAEALITYFQYRPTQPASATTGETRQKPPPQASQVASVGHSRPAAFADLERQCVSQGDSLPELVLPITRKLIIAGALASQDFVPVHHDVPAAQAAGLPDIIMNILTTCGLVARYLGDWAGPGSRLRRLKFRLLAPNTPGDTMTLQGRVSALGQDSGKTSATVEFAGVNALGPHVMGSATLQLAH